MSFGIIDTTVVLNYFRRMQKARTWVDNQPTKLAVTPITWLEVMQGAPGKSGQTVCKAILAQFDMEYLTPSDMDWAMIQMEQYRLSKGVTINDCLIASVCYRLQVPIYTYNLKDYYKTLPAELVIQPYQA